MDTNELPPEYPDVAEGLSRYCVMLIAHGCDYRNDTVALWRQLGAMDWLRDFAKAHRRRS